MPRNPEGIILHTLATPRGWGVGKSPEEKRHEVKLMHTLPKPRGRGWKGLGYNGLHWIDGSFSKGRDLDNDGDWMEEVGAHTAGWNSKAIGLGMEPIWTDDHEADGNPWDFFTVDTLESVEANIRWLMRKFPSIRWVDGHNSFAAKACPQFQVKKWWDPNKLSFKRQKGVAYTSAHQQPEINWHEVQKFLKGEGLNPGPIDGARGPKTNAALQAFGLQEALSQIG